MIEKHLYKEVMVNQGHNIGPSVILYGSIKGSSNLLLAHHTLQQGSNRGRVNKTPLNYINDVIFDWIIYGDGHGARGDDSCH